MGGPLEVAHINPFCLNAQAGFHSMSKGPLGRNQREKNGGKVFMKTREQKIPPI